MALDTTAAQKLVKYILESSPNTSSAIVAMKDCGVTIAEITSCALDHPALKSRMNEIGAAVNSAGGKWPLPLSEAAPAPSLETATLKAAGSNAGTSASTTVGKKDTAD